MRTLKKSYLENYDLLIALITHLSLTKYRSRTPSQIAKSLGLLDNKEQVQKSLDSFFEFFRKSNNKSQDSNENFYTVHARYALRRKVDNETISPPAAARL